MRAGKLNKLVRIMKPAQHAGPTGSPVTTWSQLAEVWSEIRPGSGGEAKNLESLQPDVSHTIRMRYGGTVTPDYVTPECRILYGDRLFEISSVVNVDEESRELSIAATERALTAEERLWQML